MNVDDVLKELESFGTEQNLKTCRRHGHTDPQFGVTSANLSVLKRKITTDHALALDLWKSGNADARALAMRIAEPHSLTSDQANGFVRDVSYRCISNAVAAMIGKSPLAKEKAEAWRLDESEWVARTGWFLMAQLASNDDILPDHYFEIILDEIKSNIHQAKNQVRDGMNAAIIAIGARNESLRAKALAAAKFIGMVEVDHGETGWKTPDAAEYIHKTVAHKEKLEARTKKKSA